MDILTSLCAPLPLVSLSSGVLIILLLAWALHWRYHTERDSSAAILKGRGIFLTLLFCWCGIILAILFLISGEASTSLVDLHLFSSYFYAWNQQSVEQFFQIILTILLFLPVGLLLSLIIPKAHCGVRIFLASLFGGICIEVTQYFTGRGTVRVDDVLYSMLGGLTGYLIARAIYDVAENRSFLSAAVKLFILPFCLTLFCGISFVTYYCQPYGNLPTAPSYRQPMSQTELTLDIQLNDASGTASLYQNANTGNIRMAENLASLLAKELGLILSPTVRRVNREQQFFLSSPDAQNSYTITFFLDSGNWSFLSLSSESVSVSGDLDRIRWKWESWLTENHLLDKEAIYSTAEAGILRWDLGSPENLSSYQKDFTTGSILITLTRGNIPESIYSFMSTYQYIQEVDIISPAEAYEQVEQGNFSVPVSAGDQLVINGCQLDYLADTKGFYQPVYHFTGYRNVSENTICITVPALKET